MGRDDLYISSEKDVFDSVISWISSNSCDQRAKRELLGYACTSYFKGIKACVSGSEKCEFQRLS